MVQYPLFSIMVTFEMLTEQRFTLNGQPGIRHNEINKCKQTFIIVPGGMTLQNVLSLFYFSFSFCVYGCECVYVVCVRMDMYHT